MIELEIQALAQQREGLLIEVGRLAGDCGFTLLRQRQVQDPHGVLLTMVVRGSWFKKRALRSALETCERLVSFELETCAEGESRPHFAATRKLTSGYLPPPAPAVEPEPDPEPTAEPAASASAPPDLPAASSPSLVAEPEDYTALVMRRPAPSPVAPASEPESESEPCVDVEPLEADVAAVDAALANLEGDYPCLLPRLLALDRAVAAGARAATLQLAGQRVGAWLFSREYALDAGLTLDAALASIGVPALHAFAEIELQGGQLHIAHSPLCGKGGRSGCSYYSGFLEGLLRPALARHGLTIFPLCCASYGAAECVLAISE